jgi:DNA polymerase
VTVLSIDFETRATVDLRATGVYPYAMHENTDLWCFGWAFDDEEPEIWYPGGPSLPDVPYIPREFYEHIESGGELRAWNAEFERIIWKYILSPRYGFPEPKMEQWVCSAAEAAAMSLPRSLDQCAQVTGVGQQKDQDGYGLMMRMTRPRKIHADGRIEWWEVEDRKQRLYEYCKQDVRTERAITKVLRRLTSREREIYLHTALKNDRGIPLDRELVLAARDVADEGLERANAALYQVTGGAVTGVTKVGQMKAWLNEQMLPVARANPYFPDSVVDVGPAVTSVSKAAVRELLESDLSPEVRQVLELRADTGKSSIAKLDSMLEVVCPDGQLRGLTMYHGASTGREAGRLVQPQNFPRGDVDNVESFIPAVLDRAYDQIDLFHHPVSVISSMLRAMIAAREGHDFIAADFSAIEARVLVVLAGQDDVVANWRAYDAGDKSRDQYIQNAAVLYGVLPKDVTKPQRQGGKFQELGAGYGMGWKKAIDAGKAMYGLELTEESAKKIIDNYRKTHQHVVDFWYESDAAAIEAVSVPGSVVTFGALRNLKFTKQGAYLYLILPSRRPLVYAAPRVVDSETPWGEMKPTVEISAINGYSRKWERQRMYGGLWVENIVQAVSRDLLKEADLRVEQHGYPVVLDVHDEVVTEVPEGFGSVEEFEQLLAITPEWAQGWPIKAEGWRGKRYRK